MTHLGVCIVLLCLNIPSVFSQCTLPLSDGTWISTSRGTWTVSGGGTQISNFEADLSVTVNTVTMDCVADGSTSDRYILSTNFELFFQVFVDVYTCIEIVPTERGPYSYIYYIVTPIDATTGEMFTSDQTAACTNNAYKTGANLNILTQTDTVSNATIDFPDVILGNYSVVYTNKDAAVESDWQMDSCNNTQLLNFAHASSTNNVGFTTTAAPNLLQCLYHNTFGSNVYVFMYNNGTQDGSTSFTYTCWVFAYSGSGVVATAFPNTCQDTQTSNTVQYGGEKFTFTPYYTCPLNPSTESEDGLAGWIIALIVLALLLLIAIIIVTLIYCYMRKSRKEDEEKGFVKEGERHPSPDSLREMDVKEEKKKAQEEDRAKTFRKNTKLDKERTLDLIEVSKDKGHKLKEPNRVDNTLKPEGIVTPREIVKPQEVVKTKEEIKQEKLDKQEEKRKEEQKKQEEKREKKRQEENRKREEQTRKREEENRKREEDALMKVKKAEEDEAKKKQEEALKKIIEPDGKQSIPPTTPKPELDGTLIRIKKERERKEKEKEEKRKQEEHRKKAELRKEHKLEEKQEEKVHRTVRETSSSEYETDESEQEERRKRLIEKRKRLAAASYEPIDGMLGDASVVGRKKHRRHRHFDDGGDTAGKLMSREENERQKEERRERKRRLKKLAKRKIRGQEHLPTSDSENDTRGRKKRRAGDPRGVEAPYIEQYYQKKDIEEELDNSHYWDEPETMQVEEDALATPKPQPNTEAGVPRADEDVISPSKMDIIMQEEGYDADEIRIGPNDALPDGYAFDKDGNIIRVGDGKIVMTQSQVEQRRKFGNVFSLPRLIRNEDGRPLGGYKDDEFGPTAEWDWGDPNEGNDTDQEANKSELPSRTVAFSIKDDTSTVPATPLNEMDANQRKGRQLGSAERELLKKRLFEQQQQKQKQKAKLDHPTSVPIYFAGSKGGVKDSAYIDNSQIEKQDPDLLQRSQSMRVGNKSNNMVVKSDTFSDGRSGKDARHAPASGLRRGGKLRSTWTAPSDDIPEETEIPSTDMPNRNIGSMDEFILVGGSVNKLNPPNTLDSSLPVSFCPRAFGSTRERSNISDLNMRTAPDSPRQVGDRKLQRFAGEFVADKRFFDQYIETEKLPTNASVQTRALANEGLEFIHDRAAYWIAKEPEPQRPPPSELGLRLMRMSTFHTNADSGLESRMSTMTSRPKSASDAQDNLVSSRLSRENTSEQPQSRNQQQFVTQYHGLSTGSSGSDNQPHVQKVKVKPENQT